jgi:hypothetical protein
MSMTGSIDIVLENSALRQALEIIGTVGPHQHFGAIEDLGPHQIERFMFAVRHTGEAPMPKILGFVALCVGLLAQPTQVAECLPDQCSWVPGCIMWVPDVCGDTFKSGWQPILRHHGD